MRIGAIEVEAFGETDKVYLWRYDQAVAAGYEVRQAMRIAEDAEIDLEVARKLVRLGCPPSLAFQIIG